MGRVEALKKEPLPPQFSERFYRVASDLRQSLQSTNDALTLKGLSISEAYVKNLVRIVMEFTPCAPIQSDKSSWYAVWDNQCQIAHAAARGAVFSHVIEPLDIHVSIGADKDAMLVSNVECMDTVKFAPPVLKGLYHVQNNFNNLRRRRDSQLYMSVDGGFRTHPVFMEGESCVSIDGATIGFDKIAVDVIQSSAKVVDCIPHDSWRMRGQMPAKDLRFPAITIVLGPKRFNILTHVSPQNTFKLRDVMIGPFYL